MFWNFYINFEQLRTSTIFEYVYINFEIFIWNHVGNIQWCAEYFVSEWKILKLLVKNFNAEKKSNRYSNISCKLLK